MKRSITVVLAVFLMLGVFAGCDEDRTYTSADEVISVKEGQEFVISLAANSSTGYTWEAQSSASWLKMVDKSYKADEPVLAGSGGTELFRFKALGKGTTTISFGYSRPWESQAAQQRTFTVEVK